MKLLSEIHVRVRRGFVPGLISAVYRTGCALHNLQFVEEKGPEELFSFEISYSVRHHLRSFLDVISGSPEKYHLVSLVHSMEDRIRGGLLRMTGKFPLENMTDYEIAVLGSRELISQKIDEGSGREYSGTCRNVALVAGIGRDRNFPAADLYSRYADCECDAVVLSRFTSFTPFPLIMEYAIPEDFIHSLRRIQATFRAIRIRDADGYDSFLHGQMAGDLGITIQSRIIDEIPLYLMALIFRVLSKHGQNAAETTVGFLGMDPGIERLASILRAKGFGRILGFDYDDRKVLGFENQGGLGTTVDNILDNADLIFIGAPVLAEEDDERVRPGQMVVTAVPDALNREKIMARGVREYIVLEGCLNEVVASALLDAMVEANRKKLADDELIMMAESLSGLLEEDFSTPDYFNLIEPVRSGFRKALGL